jgi:glycosyltransferase involved in cell wall biosynthesis
MAGVPCVTTDVGSAREVVIDGSPAWWLPSEAAALSGAMLEILRNEPLRNRWVLPHELTPKRILVHRPGETPSSLYRQSSGLNTIRHHPIADGRLAHVKALITGGAGFIGSHLADHLVGPWGFGDPAR